MQGHADSWDVNTVCVGVQALISEPSSRALTHIPSGIKPGILESAFLKKKKNARPMDDPWENYVYYSSKFSLTILPEPRPWV